MAFNSIDFAVFLPIVFLLHWLLFKKDLKTQNYFLLACSYFFYAWWDWRFVFLIISITAADFYAAQKIYNSGSPKTRRFLLIMILCFNLGILFFFKYYNFFIENFVNGFSLLGSKFAITPLNIILPLGLSFYVFQSLGYIFDVYLGKIEPEKDAAVFALFLSFFPKLAMGPIEKAGSLMPQLSKERNFNYDKTVDGLRQILWGLFKKIVIADSCGFYADLIFNNYNHYGGSTLLIGAVLYAFQIYCDFSGYSDIAIGAARLFGIDLMRNFAYPYFSKNIAEFWRRWHISLTRWLTDYIFLPLQMKFRNAGLMGNAAAVIVTFMVCGLWHGANWTFIAWGLLNGFFLAIFMLIGRPFPYVDQGIKYKTVPGLKETLQIVTTFFMVVFAWIFFRSPSIDTAFTYISRIFSSSFFHKPEVTGMKIILPVLIMLSVEWFQRGRSHALDFSNLKFPAALKWGFYYSVIFMIIYFGAGTGKSSFIYTLF
jgi:alginate O-acetyltransferase complex protein AlgI